MSRLDINIESAEKHSFIGRFLWCDFLPGRIVFMSNLFTRNNIKTLRTIFKNVALLELCLLRLNAVSMEIFSNDNTGVNYNTCSIDSGDSTAFE